jgi:hypothetical protein
MSTSPTLAQPAYTTQFMELIASAVTGISASSYPQPTGYQVYVTSSGSTVDQTTNVKISSYSDQIANGNEATSITFTATFSNTNAYQFNQVIFYTQVNGQNFLEVADFVFTSPVSKPQGYVLVLSITFSITTPTQYIDPVQDVLNDCNSQCPNAGCNTIAYENFVGYMPFSLFNLVFIYLLGITVSYLQSLPNVQQYAQQYNSCNQSCQSSYCQNPKTLLECKECIYNCNQYLSSNPIAIYVVANNISGLSQLLPNSLSFIDAVNVCSGIAGGSSPQNVQTQFQTPSQSEVEYIVNFSISGTSGSYNALLITLSTSTPVYYALGVLTFQGTPPSSNAPFQLTVTLSQ